MSVKNIIYHCASPRDMIMNISTGQINPIDDNGIKCISLTRNRFLRYDEYLGYGKGIFHFCIDKDKLRTRQVIEPYNYFYFHGCKRYLRLPNYLEKYEHFREKILYKLENEERVYKPIDFVSGYILRCDVYLSDMINYIKDGNKKCCITDEESEIIMKWINTFNLFQINIL